MNPVDNSSVKKVFEKVAASKEGLIMEGSNNKAALALPPFIPN